MTSPTRAPLYDLFKLIIAIILILILIFLVWIQPSGTPQSAISTSTSTPPLSVPTVATITSTPIPPTTTPLPTKTPPPTITPTQAATLTPSPMAQSTDEPLPTPIIEIPSDLKDCQVIARSQLQIGMKATILHRLNFRSSPGIFNNRILTNIPGTQVEVLGGPACTRYQNGGAYLWWQIKLPNGLVGWSAEASAFGSFYFMEPVK